MDAKQAAVAIGRTAVRVGPAEAPVDEERFESTVLTALQPVGGTLLFKLRVDTEQPARHVAAAAVGSGEDREFIVLTMPVAGGKLSAEPVASSSDPVAGIVESFAGLADALDTAA